MSKHISRRGFLKSGLAAAAGAAASSVALPQAVMASGGRELCTLLDLSKCIGCEACVEACREQWQSTVPNPTGPMPKSFPDRVPIEDWSKHKDVQDRLTPYNFLYVDMLAVNHKGQEVELNVPRRCMHCQNPPCTNLCPFGAGRVESNGIVRIDPDICLGGAKCKQVCPWDVPQRQSGVGLYLDILPEYAGNGAMFKCHRCMPLVEKGQLPRCIEVCPEKVQSIGPRTEMVAKAEALAREMAQKDGASPDKWGEYIYGLEENGGTNTLYVSPVPFNEVNQAMVAQHQEQAKEDMLSGMPPITRSGGQGRGQGQGAGKKLGGNLARFGRPSMAPVADSMASEKNLTLALMIAPIAGIAAGLGKFLAKGGSGKGGDK